ncbi:HAD-IB family hydrolase [Tenacibaculum soleae]|uniref:HAD family hydrolase n=1 Tax=Tenacibaculum soleae TaxID=447689 RepID=UPI0026E2F062|nr:HAD-IB family hydrolase [Tenacibaculum soleae]MDO6743439.1 HAD-IB family hydrolase [Tenacibaculum soleae]
MYKLALFDFCETLIQFQTADRFIDFVRNKERNKRMIWLEFLRKFLVKIKFFAVLERLIKTNNCHKRLKLYQLKGIDRQRIDTYAEFYYQKDLKTNMISNIIDLLEEYKLKGYKTLIVSGGYEEYIKYFAKEFGIDNVVATNIGFDNDKCKGVIDGIDCLNENKIPKIEKQINLSDYDLENSIAFSDSITDLPLLKLVGNGIVVSRDKSQVWAKKNNLNEIMWSVK